MKIKFATLIFTVTLETGLITAIFTMHPNTLDLKPNERRTEGTYTKYSSDDKLDTFHQWFALLKFGHGRCTANAAREIREGYITREEGVALVHKYDGISKAIFQEFLDYTNLTEDEFWDIAERWRNHNLWTKKR